MKEDRWAQIERRRRSRQYLRTILANPESTQEQIIQAKLILARRIVESPSDVRQICVEYDLSEEQSSTIIANHQLIMGTVEEKAKQTVQHLEQLLRRLPKSPEPEPPAT